MKWLNIGFYIHGKHLDSLQAELPLKVYGLFFIVL